MRSVTEIGGSSTANVDEKLVLDIKAMLECTKQQFSTGGGGLGIISVPAHLRKVEEEAFTPQLISIGPIHLSNVKLQSTKRYKEQLCESFLLWIGKDLKDLVGFIRSIENEIRSYYAKTILSSITRDDFVTMILVDAMFIFGYFCKQVLLVSDQELPCKIPNWMHPFFKLDMVLLENQLPFYVLEMLFEHATSSVEFQRKLWEMFLDEFMVKCSNIPYLLSSNEKFLKKSNNNFFKRLAIEFFQCYNFQKMFPEDFLVGMENFTDLVRLFYLNSSKLTYSITSRREEGGELPDRISGGAKLSYSASKLHEAGVKFKGVKFDEAKQPHEWGRCFLDLRFDLKNGVLEIPCIKLNAEKIRLIRNISALEQSLYVGHAYVTDLFVILDFLIDSSKDVDLLCDKGILVNYLGDSNAAASAINSLNTNILWDSMNFNYSRICEDLNVFYKKPWHRWRATLWRQYFSTPWRAASTSAAIILLLLTLAQTVCSLKSTIG